MRHGLLPRVGSCVTLGSTNVTLPGGGHIGRAHRSDHGAEGPVADTDLRCVIALDTDAGHGTRWFLSKMHPVADVERLGADPHLLAQFAAGQPPGPDHVVQRCDIGTPDRQDGGGHPRWTSHQSSTMRCRASSMVSVMVTRPWSA